MLTHCLYVDAYILFELIFKRLFALALHDTAITTHFRGFADIQKMLEILLLSNDNQGKNKARWNDDSLRMKCDSNSQTNLLWISDKVTGILQVTGNLLTMTSKGKTCFTSFIKNQKSDIRKKKRFQKFQN